MFNKLRNIISHPEHKILLKNIFSLSILQFANYVLPLITIPYVVRVIGPDKFGLISFAQAFATYFLLVVNYGFDLSATREISSNRDNKNTLVRIYSNVLFTKAFLFTLCTLIFTSLIFLIPKFRENILVFIVSYLIVAGYVLFPTWLFQGLEKLYITSIFNFIVKLLFTIGIFIFVRNKNDFYLVPLLMSLGQIFAGTLALMYSLKLLDWKINMPRLEDIFRELKNGFSVFISLVFINFYTISNTFILGFFAPHENVGYFASGSKLVLVFQTLVLAPLAQSLYPHVGKILRNDLNRGIEYIKKFSVIVTALTLPASIFLLIFAPILVKVFLGDQYLPSINVVRILSFFPFIIGLSNLYGIQTTLNLKMDKDFFKVVMGGSIINLLLNVLLDHKLAEIGSSVSWLITEIYITSAFIILLEAKGIKIIDFKFYSRYITGVVKSREI
ncbi:flippase [Candidatus Kryptonium thompsonii]|uniref:flippase n=1 Tax=Candidatus Kryptonium thompsonii TaxID=1633631 RepID=UPI000707FE7D|nr:flippase [Candidatus Kryptonium thompsoni]CUS87880.1 polysaccharide transporter, PST family [Candidatus Kryptonium thompsoni]